MKVFTKHLESDGSISETFTLAAVTADGKTSEISFSSEQDRTKVVHALGAQIGYPPKEVSSERLQQFGFDSKRLK
jgi:hypothetical protein